MPNKNERKVKIAREKIAKKRRKREREKIKGESGEAREYRPRCKKKCDTSARKVLKKKKE